MENELRKYITDYEKAGSFQENEKWVKDMSSGKGSLSNACSLAENHSNREKSYSNVYKAIARLKENGRWKFEIRASYIWRQSIFSHQQYGYYRKECDYEHWLIKSFVSFA